MRLLSRTFTTVVAVAGITVFFVGCAKEPVAELEAARAAIKAAKDVEADKYMSKNYQNLQKAMEMAENEIVNQKAKFVTMRKYKRITEMLEKTKQLADEITAEAPKVKTDMIAQVKENLGLVEGILKETKNDIKKARRKHDKAVIEELTNYLDAADSASVHASADFSAGNVQGAKEYLEEFQMLINKITSTLKPKDEAANM